MDLTDGEVIMAFFSFLYGNGVWIFPLLILLALVLLVASIRGVLRIIRRSEILRLPLLPEQTIKLPTAGKVVLALECPQLSFRWRKVDFDLTREGGSRVPGRPTLFHAQTRGIRKRKLEIRSFEIPGAGTYHLRTTGLPEDLAGDENYRIIVKRPDLGPLMVRVLGIVLGWIVFIGSLVGFILRLAGVGEGDSAGTGGA